MSNPKRPPAANDNVRPALAWPALERLVRRRDGERATALVHWRNLNFPTRQGEADVDDDNFPEMNNKVTPSEAALLSAIGWTVTGKERWAFTRRMVDTYAAVPVSLKFNTRDGHCEVTVGRLVFRDGEMVQWGRTAKGRPLRPLEKPASQKGAQVPGRSLAAIAAYLRNKPAIASPLRAASLQRPSSGACVVANYYDPLPRQAPSAGDSAERYGVEEARAELVALGVDGSVPFAQLPVPATMLKDAIVPGPQWVGGFKKPKPTGEISAGARAEPEFARQVEVSDYLVYLRRILGRHALVLDLAITDTTAKDIGSAAGLAAAYAERRGPALIDVALDALLDADDTI